MPAVACARSTSPLLVELFALTWPIRPNATVLYPCLCQIIIESRGLTTRLAVDAHERSPPSGDGGDQTRDNRAPLKLEEFIQMRASVIAFTLPHRRIVRASDL